ncbi:BON domain-containing protein [Nitrospira sp. M1]
MKQLLTYAGLIMMSMVLIMGCQSMTGKTAGTTVDDALITSSVNAKLAGDSMASMARIDVDTERGEVLLSGIVESSEARERAENLARQVEGVTHVTNNLQVELN